jgi:hypothetical protein
MLDRAKRVLTGLVLPAACLSAAAANAQELPVVFGVQLGAPVTLPECLRQDGSTPDADGRVYYYVDQAVTCAGLPYQLPKSPFRDADVHFSREETPEIISTNMIGIHLSKDSDKVIGIETGTPGYAAAALIIARLTAKFGKPTVVDDDRQVVRGISVPTKHLIWKRSGFTVDYQSASPFDTKEGSILVSTDEYDRLARGAAADSAAKRTPL